MRAGLAAYGLGAAVLASVVACSGGKSPSAGTVPAVAQPAAAYSGPRGTATLSFTIPAPVTPAGARRAPAYISPASTLLNAVASTGGAQITSNGLSLAAYCTTSGGQTVCAVPIPAPVGSDTFSITLTDSSSHVLSVGSTTATIAEGSANVTAPFVLNPVAAALAIAYNGSAAGSTAGVAVPLTLTDAAGQTIAGLGTYVNAANTPLPVSISAVTSMSSGSFSTSAGCVAQGLTFTPWTTLSSLYYCPSSSATLGSIFTVSLGTASATFSARHTGNAASAVVAAAPAPSSPPAITTTSISGGDGANNFAIAGSSGSNYYVYVGNYASSAWALCSGVDGAALLTKDDAYVLAVPHGTAALTQFAFSSTADTCGSAVSTGGGSTGSDIIAMINDPSSSHANAYALSSDFSSVRTLHDITLNGPSTPPSLTANVSGISCGAQTLTYNATYPTSLAVGPGGTLYVGCFNGLSISEFATQPSFSPVATVVAVGSSPNTGVWVAANPDIAYGVAAGGSGPIVVYTLSTTSPNMRTAAYTFPSLSTALTTGLDTVNQHVGQPVVVGNDDRLYLAVNDGTTNRVVAYDPYTGTLTDPAITLSSVLNTAVAANITLSLGPHGTILVGGSTTGTTFGALTWP